MPIVDILSIRYIDYSNCNYCIVGFGLILILTTNTETLSRASVRHAQGFVSIVSSLEVSVKFASKSYVHILRM